jgi:hypothetical protein
MIPENRAAGAATGRASYNPPIDSSHGPGARTMPPSARPAVAALISMVGLTAFELPAPSQDAKLDVARQRSAVAANLKKAGFTRTTIVESKQFIVATTLSEEKAKALGAALDRVAPIARKALKFDAKEEVWTGKLAVYYLPEGSDFKTFIRSVVVSQPEGVHYSLRSDEPFVVDPADGPANATEADQLASAMAVVASAYLRAKEASLPDWLTGGFGRVTAMRAEGLSAKRYLAYKSAARTLANRGGKPSELWSESPPASAEVLANSFTEYLAYGPGAANFSKLIAGLRPDENGTPANIAAAFEATGWKDIGMLEAAWRKWALVR